jgi:hypothetical protein
MVFKRTGLELVKTYKPLAKENEPYKWVNETRTAPWVIYVLKKGEEKNFKLLKSQEATCQSFTPPTFEKQSEIKE